MRILHVRHVDDCGRFSKILFFHYTVYSAGDRGRALQAAADAFGWQPAAGPSRRGVGMACAIDAGTYVATIVQVRVDAASGLIRVVRVVCALDMGVVVNRHGRGRQS